MGKGAASAVGMDDAPVTTDDSVAGLTKTGSYFLNICMVDALANSSQIDSATREKLGGVFASFDGKIHQW
jgi:hypothetical protein